MWICHPFPYPGSGERMERHGTIWRIPEGAGSSYKRPPRSSGPTSCRGYSHCAGNPNGHPARPASTAARRQTGSSRENTAPIHLELADGTAFTTGAAFSTLHGSRGGAHAAGKSSADTGGAKEAAAGGEVFLLRRGWPSCHFMSSQGILVVKRWVLTRILVLCHVLSLESP